MLPKQNRLNRKSFNQIFNKTHSIHGKFFSLRLTGDGNRKFSIIVPKSVESGAVKRNRLRRIGYEAIRSIFPSIPRNISGIVFFKKNGSNIPFSLIKEEFIEVFRKLFKE